MRVSRDCQHLKCCRKSMRDGAGLGRRLIEDLRVQGMDWSWSGWVSYTVRSWSRWACNDASLKPPQRAFSAHSAVGQYGGTELRTRSILTQSYLVLQTETRWGTRSSCHYCGPFGMQYYAIRAWYRGMACTNELIVRNAWNTVSQPCDMLDLPSC